LDLRDFFWPASGEFIRRDHISCQGRAHRSLKLSKYRQGKGRARGRDAPAHTSRHSPHIRTAYRAYHKCGKAHGHPSTPYASRGERKASTHHVGADAAPWPGADAGQEMASQAPAGTPEDEEPF
jgi:hypothetical protein